MKIATAVVSVVAAHTAAVIATNRSEKIQNIMPEFWNNACRKEEDLVVDAAKKTWEFLTSQVDTAKTKLKEVGKQKYTKEVREQMIALETEIKELKARIVELKKAQPDSQFGQYVAAAKAAMSAQQMN